MISHYAKTMAMLVVSGLLLLAAPSQAAEAPSGKPIVIGVVAGVSGWMRYLDYPGALAARMAVEDINAAGGVLGRPLKWIIADSQSGPGTAATAALTSKASTPTSIEASGLATRLWYQSGFRAVPPLEAKIT